MIGVMRRGRVRAKVEREAGLHIATRRPAKKHITLGPMQFVQSSIPLMNALLNPQVYRSTSNVTVSMTFCCWHITLLALYINADVSLNLRHQVVSVQTFPTSVMPIAP